MKDRRYVVFDVETPNRYNSRMSAIGVSVVEGGRIVREVMSGVTEEEYVSLASDIAAYHHERWDGKGYPAGLAGEEIPLSARIMAIADVFDAMISPRCYRESLSREEAFAFIRQEAGTRFDPQLAAVLQLHREEF